MREADVIVVGGGPAGVSAAIEAAKSGLSVMLCEQRPALGGAIHRQPAEGATPVAVLPSLRGRWQALSAELSASGVDVRTRRAFVGVDSTGAVLIEDRAAGKVEVRRPRALILSCGAVERVRPRRGWHLPGVAAAGGLQVMLKEGRVPGGTHPACGERPAAARFGRTNDGSRQSARGRHRGGRPCFAAPGRCPSAGSSIHPSGHGCPDDACPLPPRRVAPRHAPD